MTNGLVNENSAQILNELLNSIEKVDFWEYVRTYETVTKLQKKHYLVSVIEILLKKTNEQKFSLCRKNEMVFLYNGEYWEHIENNLFKDFLGQVALKLGVDKFDAKLHNFKDELLKQFISDARLKEIQVDNTTTLINLKNGTFEINATNQTIREFRKSDFLTYQLPFSFDSNVKSPKFDKFLNEVLPEKELQNVLAEYLGYIFIKSSVLKLEKVLLLFGTGANGKSVLFEIICALIGNQNITNYSLQSLTGKDGYHRAMIANKLLNYASEINGKLEISFFKQLASGEPVEARLPYGNPVLIKDYAKFIFNCNELPRDTEQTNAFFRRFIILPFRYTIPPEKQDKKLAEQIINEELTGIFNWVIDGLKRLLKNGNFTQSEIVKNEVAQYAIESDSVLMFLEDLEYEASIVETITVNSIYNEYKSYCLENGYITCSVKTFSQRLVNRGIIKKRTNPLTVFYIQKKFISN
ncbi:DNA primase [Flavobacterium columnare]|uniref:DNA primase family protein n=1 Tax=Flavobacterium columnare TaxID=996 RepID=UPI0018965387|nr:phage/plasmid primase, P4 family [Flavobacterium columnare]MBF6653973.1 DNA primase [Flavobacterium columnare]MBF6654155.1 DNA primase [Flavobacterium columnare]MBF6657450.1 DNA primase [Flavobacterium columnare]